MKWCLLREEWTFSVSMCKRFLLVSLLKFSFKTIISFNEVILTPKKRVQNISVHVYYSVGFIQLENSEQPIQ